MSINKLISIKNPILDAKMQLGIDHDKDDPWFTALASEAETKIGSALQYERQKTLVKICQCSAPIPTDAVLVEIAMLGDYTENCNNLLSLACGNNAVTNTNLEGQANFLVIDMGGVVGQTLSFGIMRYYIQNNKIIFDTDLDDRELTIQYLRYKRDCDGFFEVGQNHVTAIMWYIVWRYWMRQSKKNYVDRSMIGEAQMQWNNECRHARAEDNRMSYTERRDAAAVYSNPYTGRGIWQGMYTTLGDSYFIW